MKKPTGAIGTASPEKLKLAIDTGLCVRIMESNSYWFTCIQGLVSVNGNITRAVGRVDFLIHLETMISMIGPEDAKSLAEILIERGHDDNSVLIYRSIVALANENTTKNIVQPPPNPIPILQRPVPRGTSKVVIKQDWTDDT